MKRTRDLEDIKAELRELFGKHTRFYTGRHHARFIPADVPVHVISRVFQGRYLLVPHKALNRIIAGVLGKAQGHYKHVRLFAIAVMCNHLHMMLMGPPHEVAAFIAYIKREISYRWGRTPFARWKGTMFHRYVSTALPTPESQEVCLKYILSQGVKEKAVDKPHQWPGVHAARHLLQGVPLEGELLNATAWCREKDRQSRMKHPKPVKQSDYYETYTVTFSPIPAWRHLSKAKRQTRLEAMVAEIVEAGRAARKGEKALGAARVQRLRRTQKKELPKLPWFEKRRRFIAWANPRAPETRAFIARHWEFQEAFHTASKAFRAGNLTVAFPPGAFRPVTMQPLAAAA